MEKTEHQFLAKESYIIIGICLLDLATTLWLVSTGRATEGNPVMSYYLSIGFFMLVLMKVVLLVLPVFVLEWCRRRRTRFVHVMLRLAIVAYVSIYALGFLHLNVLASDRAESLTPVSYVSHSCRLR